MNEMKSQNDDNPSRRMLLKDRNVTSKVGQRLAPGGFIAEPNWGKGGDRNKTPASRRKKTKPLIKFA